MEMVGADTSGMRTFDIRVLNEAALEAWRPMSLVILAMGIIFSLLTFLLLTVAIFLPDPDLLSMNFAMPVLAPAVMGVMALTTYLVRAPSSPAEEVSISQSVIELKWKSGKVSVINWGSPGSRLTLFDSSRLPWGRKWMNPNGWYRLKMPHSPVAHVLSEEAFYEIIRLANRAGFSIARKTASEIHGVCEMVVITSPSSRGSPANRG